MKAENSKCNPTIEMVVAAIRRSRAGEEHYGPGRCIVCNCPLEVYRVEIAGTVIENTCCRRAEELYDEAVKLVDRPAFSRWQKECPMLYQSIEAQARHRYKHIDWKEYDNVLRWDPKTKRGLFLVGESGAGKTTALWHLMRELERRGVDWCMLSAQELSDAYFEASRRRAVDRLVEKLVCVPVLALDDFGKEVITEGVSAFIYNVFNRRVESLKPVLATTRFSSETLPERFASSSRERGEDLVRRIQHYCDVIAFFDKAA